MSEVKIRTVWKGTLECAECGKPNDVEIQKKVLVPAEPAETEIVVIVKKSSQATLD